MEGKAITTEIIRGAVKVEGLVAEVCEERKRTIPLQLVTCLEFSFRSIKQIDFLVGFECLTRLLLDNNHLTKIENIAHLTTLKELDLSFNSIERIEGLETLTNLTDLSLFNNKITKLEGLETLEDLVCLSLGNNFISELEDVAYFRQFRKLRLLVLSGNPISKDPEYRLFVIAFMRNMLYLDHKLCFKHQIDQAKDEYQDELQELKEKELQEEEDIKNRLAKRAETELYEKANLVGVDGLLDKMLKDDPEHARLSEVPTLLEGLDEFREKHQSSTAELKSLIIELYYKEQAEIKLWQSAMTEDVNQKDEDSRALVNKFDELKKKVNGAAQSLLFLPESLPFHVVVRVWLLCRKTIYVTI
ncbi:hypothetical protein R1sor_024793 [Riccia sorocarpa]|uniref:Dynein regulatory complex subunit 3 n=1 Tax=Riccia sorocarpa TaxID=122646 RepID=A0ABD3GTR8_9MARC